MVSLDDAVLARLGRHGITYEILVDPEAMEVLNIGDSPDDEILELLAVDDVFIDWSEGERAPKEDLLVAFSTQNVASIARRILKEGEIQLTQKQREKMTSQKYKRVIESITRNAWNPQTKMPHPRDRIERALVEAKFRVEPLRPVEPQVQVALKLLRPLMPIAFEKIKVAIKVPSEFTGAAYGIIQNIGEVKQEQWLADGDLIMVIEIPAGIQTEVYDRLNGATQGKVETRIIS